VRIRAVALACSPLALFLASPAAAQAQDPAYRINPGDELTISVWGEERLGRDVSVLPDGTIAYPLVGQVHAAGMLPTEIESRITAGLKPQYRGPVPQVTVSVKRASGFQFSVIGKVKAPGTFTPGRYVNALDALSMAGGPTEFAEVGGIRIIRKTGPVTQSLRVRVADLLKGQARGLVDADIPTIHSGDTLVVP
jgi:polysaccharide export outer membrane protein